MSLCQRFCGRPLEVNSYTGADLVPDCSQEAVLISSLSNDPNWKHEALYKAFSRSTGTNSETKEGMRGNLKTSKLGFLGRQ